MTKCNKSLKCNISKVFLDGKVLDYMKLLKCKYMLVIFYK